MERDAFLIYLAIDICMTSRYDTMVMSSFRNSANKKPAAFLMIPLLIYYVGFHCSRLRKPVLPVSQAQQAVGDWLQVILQLMTVEL